MLRDALAGTSAILYASAKFSPELRMTDTDRAGGRELILRWKAAGPALEAQRWAELSTLTDEDARRATLDLFALWRPTALDEFGAELVEQQRVFHLRRAGGTPHP
jgi:hypothetical protein